MGNKKSRQQLIDQLVQNENITNIISNFASNFSTISGGEQKVYIKIGGDWNCKNINITQKISFSGKFLNNISNEDFATLKVQITNDLKSVSSQTSTTIKDFLALEIGDNEEVIQEIYQTIINKVEQNFTRNTVMNAIHQTAFYQEDKVVVGGSINCDNFEILQDMQVDLVAENILKNLVNTVANSEVINKMTSEATQIAYSESKGLTDLVKSFTGPLAMILVAVVIGFAMFGSQFTKNITNPKFLIVIGILIAGYLILAKIQGFFPFKKETVPEHWGCEIKDNEPTGKCVQYDTATDGPFDTSTLCNEAISKGQVCQQYWGCEIDSDTKIPTGKCVKKTSLASGGIYNSEEECNEAVNDGTACRQYWTCAYNSEGKLDGKCESLPENPYDPTIDIYPTQVACESSNSCVEEK